LEIGGFPRGFYVSQFLFVRRHSVAAAAALLGFALLPNALCASAQSKASAAQGKVGASTVGAEVKPRIRAITAFINLDRATYQQQVAEALAMLSGRALRLSRAVRGGDNSHRYAAFFGVHQGANDRASGDFLQSVDALAVRKIAACIGPAMLNAGDPESQGDLLRKSCAIPRR